MFFQLSQVLPRGADQVLTELRPSEISEFLEALWSTGRAQLRNVALGLGPTLNPVTHQAMARSGADLIDQAAVPPPPAPVQWHHVAYAYMLENTRMVEIFRQVVLEWTHGERLPIARLGTQRWLQATEQVFFANAWPYSVRALTSSIRRDAGAVRRNVYYRLLGMDLNHAGDDGSAAFVKPTAANRDFALVFEALLTEVWRGYTYRTAFAAQNETDDSAIINLVRRLREMLQARRLETLLSREEFDCVAMMSWFHLVLRTNTSIIVDLNAEADGVADRLKKIGDRVGIPAHTRSDAYIIMAEPLSRVLLAIEGSAFPLSAWPQELYSPAGAYNPDMLEIITQWAIATGRDLKDLSARPSSQLVLASTGAALSGTSLPATPRMLTTGR